MTWLALAYPLLAHLGVWLHSPVLQLLALVSLALGALGPALRARKLWAFVVLVAVTPLLWWLISHDKGMYALYLPSIAVPVLLLVVFGNSLRAGSTPLVTRFAELIRGQELPPLLKTYTRHVTQMWCVVASLMLISGIVTAIFMPPVISSLITNVIHYIVLGAVFVLEYAYRHIKYTDHLTYTLREYLQRLVRVRPL
jgi:uncharacterized membrane protein